MNPTPRPSAHRLHIGWASTSITPDQPVKLAGQLYARISEGVLDPVTATALALSSGPVSDESAVVLVSCDLVGIADSLRDAVRREATARVPELAPLSIVLNATHTHTAPLARQPSDDLLRNGIAAAELPIDLPAMDPAVYIDWAAERIAGAIETAWRERRPGSIGYGQGQALIGRNRRSVFAGGVSRMYGKTDADDFSHIEGYEDHTLNLLATHDEAGNLTGLVVNVACPSQATEHLYQVSADYWHETREELRRRLGQGLFVLPQCAAAGDQSPHIQWGKAAEERMMRLAGRSLRQEIATRLADAVDVVLPIMANERLTTPDLRHHAETVALPRRRLSEDDVREAMADAAPLRAELDRLLRELEAHPELRQQPRWYKAITGAHMRACWHEGVKARFALEKTQSTYPAEMHVIRLGDLALVTDPFEYYLDFGIRIKARSPAVQTLTVQLAGAGTYVPTERAVAGKSYGAVPASTPVGPEGGSLLAERSIAILRALWSS